jgi:hypothetical protein
MICTVVVPCNPVRKMCKAHYHLDTMISGGAWLLAVCTRSRATSSGFWAEIDVLAV